MAGNLKTSWIILATTGPVVHGDEDGRFIKKEWLEDMAEVYNSKVFTAKIWPEHRRYASAGVVLALKMVAATEPELEGEFHLMGILSPNDWLVQANRAGDYTFPSIEVGENYRGTGKFFLKGLGVTDEPASAGVTELKFSKNGEQEKAIVFAGPQINVGECLDKTSDNKTSLIKRIFSKASGEADNPQQDTLMTEEQIKALEDRLATRMEAAFSKLATKPEAAKEDEQAPAGDENTDFTALQTENAELKTRLDELEKNFSAALNTPAGSTNAGENAGDADLVEII